MTSLSLMISHCPVALNGGLFISPGYGIHPDRVLDSWELILVRSGCLHIEENGVEYRVHAGESIILPAGRRHRGLSEYSNDLSFYWLHFKPGHIRLLSPLTLTQHTQVWRKDWLATLLHQFISDQTSRVLTPLYADTLLLLMLNEISLKHAASMAGGIPALIRKVEEYISQSLHQGITPKKVARFVEYHPAYLSRLFKKVHGMTLGQYIHHIQILQARQLLRDSSIPLKQIARRCGFRDTGYFRRIFRREMEIPPREYRNRFGLVHINRH